MSRIVYHVLSEMVRLMTFAADFEVLKMINQSLDEGSQWHLGLSAQIPKLAKNAKLLFPWDAS